MRIVVFGATGHTGREVVRLASAGRHEVVAVTRRPVEYEAPPRVEVRPGDVLQPDSLSGLMTGLTQ